MNDDQAEGLGSTGYWRNRAEQESAEKKIEAKAHMKDIKKWWAEKDLWDQFYKSYPVRFSNLLFMATAASGVTRNDQGGYVFQMPTGGVHEFGVYISDMPQWDLKSAFEECEKHFSTPIVDNK